MTGRVFEKGQIIMGGQRVGAFTLRCSHPICRNSADIINRSSIKSCSAAKLRVGFENKGWYVGDRISEDLCPDHARAALEERRARRRPHATNLKLVTTEGQEIMAVEPPKAMSRDDKRIINAKLHDVYINEREGYQTPWTDKKVAEDLGVPLAWVVEIREDLFGPAADNSEVREYLERAEKAKADAADLLAKIHTQIITIEGEAATLPKLKQLAAEIARQLDATNVTGQRIQRAVAS